MKILYISHLHPPKNAPLKNMGGMQRVSMQLISELGKREGVTLEPIILRTSWRAIEFKTFLFLLRLVIRLPKIVEKYEPDIILFSSMVTASLAAFTRKKIDIPMVTINHGHDVTLQVGIYQKLVPKIFNMLDGVISVSEATKKECIKRGMEPDKGVVLPNGFDHFDFKNIPHKNESRKALEHVFKINLESKALLLTVGRLVKRKGHEWFIKNVISKIESPFIYLVVGDGPEHRRLQEIVSNSPYEEQIIFVGRQSDDFLKQVYNAADLFIMPNIIVPGDLEGFGIVLLEANFASTFAIATDIEGIKDVVTDGVNGYKIPVKDADRFAQKIDEVLEQGPIGYGAKSSKFVEENFAWDSVADRYISYLKMVVQNFKDIK